MDHPLRLIPLLTVTILAVTASPAEDPAPELRIHWSPTEHSPAVPTHQPNWLIAVAPGQIAVAEGSAVQVSLGGESIAASVLHYDDSHGLCLIETAKPLPGLELTQLATHPIPEAGSKLHCWKPGGSCPTTVAGKEYSIRGEPLSSPLLKVHVAEVEEFCDPGTPLVCEGGTLFGILTEVVSMETGEAHAIPASCLHKLLTEYERFQHSGKVWVGLVFDEDAQTPQVVDVRADSPAEKAGLKTGDVILGVGDHGMSDLDELTQTMHLLIAGDPVEVTVLRGLKEVTLKLIPEFADRPDATDPQG